MKKLILTATALSALLPAAAPAQAIPGAIIAIVDARRVSAECVACKAANAQLQSQQASIQQRVQQLQTQLEPERTSLEAAAKAANGKPTPALQTRADAFEKRGQAAQTEIAGRQQALQAAAQSAQSQIGAKLLTVANQVMVQRGANLVMDKNATIANGSALEITDAVLAEMNRQLPSITLSTATTAPTQGR